jgi:hypothetical protein
MITHPVMGIQTCWVYKYLDEDGLMIIFEEEGGAPKF